MDLHGTEGIAEATGREKEDKDWNIGMSGSVATRRSNYRLVRSLCTEKQKCFALGPPLRNVEERGRATVPRGIKGQGSYLQHLLIPPEFSQTGSL